MKILKALSYPALAIGAFLIFGACETTADVTSSEPAQANMTDAVSLFDGKTLKGWHVTLENPDSFRVEDGAIVADGPRAHLFYVGNGQASFENFELSLKVKTKAGSNSGVFFHTQYQDEDWPRHGLEAQVNATYAPDPRKTGSLYAVADIRVYSDDETVPALGFENGTNAYTVLGDPPHADGQWFDYVIRVEDGVATTRVNGKPLVKWAQPQDWPDQTRRLGSGTFALQAHDPESVVYFKDIFVRELE